jgi:glycosyltransferase involved in cell wall biosynthesis
MSRVDCGVFPARAEGWNLELLELMACGKHLIATDYSGHTEFAKKGVHLIPIDRLEPAIDNIWFHGQGNWAYIGQDQKDLIVEYMKKIHTDKQSQNLKLNNEAAIAAQEFTWAKSTDKLIKAINNDFQSENSSRHS